MLFSAFDKSNIFDPMEKLSNTLTPAKLKGNVKENILNIVKRNPKKGIYSTNKDDDDDEGFSSELWQHRAMKII